VVLSGKLRSFLLVLALCWLGAASASAHDLEVTVTMAPPAVVLRAAYGGAEAAPFAQVQVFAPGAAAAEYQTGRTDRRGYFSFVPEAGGAWRVVVDDEEGHRREITVAVPEPFSSGAAAPAPRASRFERALLGVALILGMTGFLYGYKARRAG
jgi:nickel transport protein